MNVTNCNKNLCKFPACLQTTTVVLTVIYISMIKCCGFLSLYRSVIYLEGNLETKVFSDPVTGLVRRVREVAIRRDGMYFLLNSCNVL